MVVNVLVMGQIVYLLNCPYLLAFVMSRKGLLDNRYILVAVGLLLMFQLTLIHLPVIQQLFGTVALDAAAWGRIIAVCLMLFLLVELGKYLLRRRGIKDL